MIESEIYSALSELKRRSEHASRTYIPTELDGHHQKSFHESTARYRLVTGGNQSGKSHCAAYEIACWATQNHKYRSVPAGDIDIWVISAEYITIRTGIYRHLLNLIPDWDILEKGPNVPGHSLPSFLKIRRKDGSKAQITFMSSKGEARQKFQAAAIHLISIDEEIAEIIWEELEARTLVTGGEFIISATLVESYDWVLSLEHRAELGDDNVFLTRLRTDRNPYVDQTRLRELMGKWSKETQEYRIYGKSRRSTGLVYNTWDPDKHVIKPFKIPDNWPRWCAIDPGFRTCAVLWVTVSEPDWDSWKKPHIIAYRELYAQNEALYEIARTIKELEGWILDKELSLELGHFVWERPTGGAGRNGREPEVMINRVIDPSSIRKSEAGDDSVITQLHQRYGLACNLADNSKTTGIEACRFALEEIEDGLPQFMVFSNLENFLDERRTYRLRVRPQKKDQNEPIDEPVKARDHLMDCWRYLMMEYPRWEDRKQDSTLAAMQPGLGLGVDYSRNITSIAAFLEKKHRRNRVDEFLGEA
jgi:hypothetical protein